MLIGNRSVRPLLAALAVISASLAPGNEASGSSVLELDPAHVPWSRLRFLASTEMASAQTEVRLAPIPAIRLKDSLQADVEGPSPPVPAADALLMTVVTETSSNLPLTSDKTWRTRVWFLPGDATALQRTRQKIGKEPDAKIFRHFPDGVQRIRAEPDSSGEAERSPGAWSKTRSNFYHYGPARAGCPQVLDPATLFYVISAVEMSRDDPPLALCVFNKKTLYQVDIHVAGSQRLAVGYTQRRGTTEEQVETKPDVQTIVISSRPLQPAEQEPEPFEFFEMRGDIGISFDPASRLPVKVRGVVKNVGEITLELVEGDLTD